MQRKNVRAGKHGKGRVKRVTRRRVTSTNPTSADASTNSGAEDTGAAKIEVVGIVETDHSMNTVEVNEQALNNELNAALATAPATEAPPVDGQTPEAQAVVVESWEPIIKQGVMPIVCVGILPQWEITDAEREELGTALALCLDQAFPGALDGKYACWVRLILAGGGLVAVRFMQHGKLPPIGPKLVKADAAASQSTETKAA